jgi:hypothetical protein
MFIMKHAGIVSPGLLVLCLCGCAAPTGNLSGKVSYQGKKLVWGSVVLVGEDQKPVQARIQPDGTYLVKDVPFGLVRIAVHSPDPGLAPPDRKQRGPKDAGKADIIPSKASPRPETADWFPIPASYNDLDKSGLSMRIDRPESSFDILLK